MQQELNLTLALLSRTPAALDALLRGLPEAWTAANEGEKTWSVTDVLGHLILADRTNWLTRAKLVLEFGESKAFEPFDRKGYWRVTQGRTLDQLLEEFARVRSGTIAEVRALNLDEEKLALRGGHPALGVITLSQLMAAWAAHDLTHLHQISRIMAHQYREAVGPWNKFLGVMQCAGHGE